MGRIAFVFLSLFSFNQTGICQVEWKAFAGYDLTPVVTSSFSFSFGYDSNNNYYEIRGNTKRTLENLGSAGIGIRIPIKRILIDLDFYTGRYRLIENKRQEYYNYQGSQEQLYYTSDRTNYSRSIYPGVKISMGYSITQKFKTKLFIGNFGKGLYMTGLAVDKKLGKHWNVGLSAYNPIAMGVESGWELEKSYGVGFQLGYCFSQKEKSKRSNAVPTVL
jgi:hypothetical protein